MSNFGLVVIGAHHGFWLEDEVLKVNKDVLLVEPVDYNYLVLKKSFSTLKNIFFDKTFISARDGDKINFYYVKENSISKLGKHWASGIGSFSKKFILDHKSKRFKIEENDIDEIKIQSITFNELCGKYNISMIDKLLIDAEGSEKKIIESIDYKKIIIKELVFEYKHLDDTFFFKNNLKKLVSFLNSKNFKETTRDKENITFKLV